MSAPETPVDLEELEAAFAADPPVQRSLPRWVRPALVAPLALLIAVYLEIALAIDTRILGALPGLVLIVLVGLALRLGPLWGAVLGFAAGLVLDVALQVPLGRTSLVLTPIGWAVGAYATTRRRVSLAMSLTVLVIAVAAEILGELLVGAVGAGDAPVWGAGTVRALAEVTLTLLVGIPVLLLLRRLLGVPEATR